MNDMLTNSTVLAYPNPPSPSSTQPRRYPRLTRIIIDPSPYPAHLSGSLRSCPPLRGLPYARTFVYQSGRHRPSAQTPYGKPTAHNERNGHLPARPGSSSNSNPTPRGRGTITNLNPLRVPEGTPHRGGRVSKEDHEAHKAQRAKLSEKLNSDGMKDWLRNRHISPGVMDMSVSRMLRTRSIVRSPMAV